MISRKPELPLTREGREKRKEHQKYLQRDLLIGNREGIVRYHTGGSMKLNARILHLAHMVYL
jgi:hypothetical protein